MAKSIIPTKKELFNRTPFFVTVLGYLFSLAILLGAASTFLIRSDLYSKGSLVLHLTIERVALDADSVVVGVSATTGNTVREGDSILGVLDGPQSVALARLRKSLRENMEVLDEGDKGFRDAAKQLMSEIPDSPDPRALRSPIDGILIQMHSPNPDQAEDILFVPPGEPLFSVASLERVLLEIDTPPDKRASIQRDDILVLLVPAWAEDPIDAQVSSIEPNLTATVERDSIPASVLDELKENLLAGTTAHPGPDCWIKVGTQRLFDRLFEK